MTETLEAPPAQATSTGPVFTVEPEELKDALAWSGRAISTRPPQPILSGVRLTAEGGTLTVSAFDFETFAEAVIEAMITTPGQVIVSAARLTEITKVAPKKTDLTFTTGARVRVSAGRSQWELLPMPLGDYPDLPHMPEPAGTVDGKTLAETLTAVSVSTSEDHMLPVLTGIRLELGETLEALATDKYKLSHGETGYQRAMTDPQGATVKAAALMPLVKALESAGDVQVGLNEDQISLRVPGRRAVLNLVDGEYPKIKRLFPNDTPIRMVVDTIDLREAVKRVQLAAERNGHIRMDVTPTELTLSAGVDETATEVIECEATIPEETDHDGNPLPRVLTVGYRPEHLNGALATTPTARLEMGWVSTMKPVLISPVKETPGGVRHLIMPVRLPGGQA